MILCDNVCKGTKAVFGDAYNFLTTKEKDEKSRFIFFSPHPNLVTVLTHRADGGFLVAIYLLQLQRGGGAAQVVDVGIVGKTDEAILIDDIQGSGDALKFTSLTPTLR